ncbi:hypothetical protein TWF102_011106 [Orbilia oligospora]|uniref:GRAM domain-containing protein n=1 Tax=Orbilia oligospora TaxID=2813651 RepID=A0A7C8J862_ORBOL|nr:hypothetical protein TWF102_011106 [Orbilia oligospora]KAF3094232.1 hypothetical protein TWF103_010627 [Orbilia oligospora]KAF3153148.1 hypothetical protein TWF594_000185 [Orbilia oligospora]
MVYEDSNSDFSSYDEVPEFSGLTGDQAPAPSPSTDTVTCQASQIQPANAGSHGLISVSPNLDSGPHHILETENTPQVEAKDEFSDGNESEDLQYQSSAGSSTIHSSSTRNILQKAHSALSHPVATSRKFKAHHYHTHHERKGKRKPQRLCQELAKAEAGSARPIMSPTNKSNSSSHPVKSKVKHVVSSFSKSHPKRLTKVLASNTLSNHILGLDLDPFRLTKSDVEFIQLVSRRRFETDGQVISEREQRLRELKIARQKMLVNWVSDRHIRSASVVRAKALKYPDLDKTIEEEGFMKYFGDVALYISQRFIPIYTSPWEEIPRYDSSRTMSHVERIAIGMAPFQEWAMVIRNVYRWEDPVKTARWMAIYTVLWWSGYLITFGYAYLISRVLRNRQDWNEVKRVKRAIYRARDQQQNVRRITELIERHGSDGWVEALPDSFGSWAQLKLGDFADALEIIRNFYEWRDPEQTVCTLIFFGACLLIGMFTSMAYCWRIVTFVFGLWFFISSPIASRYPRYRLVVSPFKWVFWGIPTHADIAYSEFRADAANAVSDPDMKKKSAKRNAKRRRAADFETPVMVIDDDVEDEEEGNDGYTTSPDLDEDDNYDPEELISPHDMERDPESLGGKQYIGVIYCGFRCIYRGHPGKLYLSDYGLVFETEVSKKVILEIKWRDVRNIEKEESLSMGKVGKVHALGVAMACGERIKFEAMLKRDLAFNRIIGFSGLQWQSEA